MTATDWEQMLVDRLTGYAPLAALIGERVHPLELPQDGALPAIVYTVIDDPEDLGGHHGIARVQITPWAVTYGAAKQIRDCIRDALRDYAGATVTDRIEDIDVSAGGIPAGKDPELGLYRRDIDVRILHIRRD